VDPRVVVNPVQARQLLAVISYVRGQRHRDRDRSGRLRAFFACLYNIAGLLDSSRRQQHDQPVVVANNDVISVQLPVRLWAVVDGTVDNAVSTANITGNQDTVRTGKAIRQAGWDQVPWVDGEWPPGDQVIAIALSSEEWRFALCKLIAVHEYPVDDEDFALGGETLDVLWPQLMR